MPILYFPSLNFRAHRFSPNHAEIIADILNQKTQSRAIAEQDSPRFGMLTERAGRPQKPTTIAIGELKVGTKIKGTNFTIDSSLLLLD